MLKTTNAMVIQIGQSIAHVAACSSVGQQWLVGLSQCVAGARVRYFGRLATVASDYGKSAQKNDEPMHPAVMPA